MLRVFTTLVRRTDRERWSDPRNIYDSWEPRTKMVAALVPNNSRVIEFGAAKRRLEKYLDPSCTYQPSDVVERGEGTLVCDLNERPLPDLGADVYDVAVIIGVLEYVRDVPAVLDWLAQYVSMFVVTYACAKANGKSPRARVEKVARLRHGWVNDYREEEFRALFTDRGFRLIHDDNWENQRVFAFSRRPSSD
jgi:hypothetical protein